MSENDARIGMGKKAESASGTHPADDTVPMPAPKAGLHATYASLIGKNKHNGSATRRRAIMQVKGHASCWSSWKGSELFVHHRHLVFSVPKLKRPSRVGLCRYGVSFWMLRDETTDRATRNFDAVVLLYLV